MAGMENESRFVPQQEEESQQDLRPETKSEKELIVGQPFYPIKPTAPSLLDSKDDQEQWDMQMKYYEQLRGWEALPLEKMSEHYKEASDQHKYWSQQILVRGGMTDEKALNDAKRYNRLWYQERSSIYQDILKKDEKAPW